MQINKEKLSRIYKTVMIIIITAIVTFCVTSILLYRTGGIKYIAVTKGDTTGLGATLTSFKELLNKRYLYDMNESEMIEAAIKGYISAVGDEYTEYFTPEEMQKFTTYTTGNYVGIGIYMEADTENNVIKVSSTIKNSSAERAGLQAKDIIAKVNGVSYDASELTKMSTNIKGEEGTTVDLEIIRNGQTINYTLERASVELYPVEGVVLEENIGYIELATFDEGCAEQFKTAYEELKNKNVKSLIIDLRNNGGGIVDEALQITDYILDKDSTMLITADKDKTEEIETSKNDPIIDIPIIILVNDETASASEILAGAIQDYKKATIVGEKTFGKGVIQELYTLNDGSGLKITIKEYFTPNRNKINKVGITPDYEIVEEKETEEDEQIRKAIELLK